MDYYNRIEEALERLIRWDAHKEFYSVSVSFKIEVLDELQDKDKILIPHVVVNPNKNEKDEITDLELSLSLFFDGVDDSKSQQIYNEIIMSKLGPLATQNLAWPYILNVSLGKDIKIAAALILSFLRMFSKSKDIEIKPLYYCENVLNGELTFLKRYPDIQPSVAIKNLMDTMFERTKSNGESLVFNVLRDNRDNDEFLAEVTINKWLKGEGYTAWIRTCEIRIQYLDSMFQRLLGFLNKYCTKEFNIHDNGLETRVEFTEFQIEDLIYFISECLYMYYPSLQEDKIIAQFKYVYFSPVVQFYLTFYSDGKRPSDKELEYAYQLKDNLEYEVDEDEYFNPENE